MRLIPLFLLTMTTAVFARLADTPEKAESRYGLPKKITGSAAPLVEGAREVLFLNDGWRIRCAFLKATDGKEYVVREEYVREVGSSPMTIVERETILDAERNDMTWRGIGEVESSQRRDGGGWDPTFVSNRRWLRQDGASAALSVSGSILRLELPQARMHELELQRLRGKGNDAATPVVRLQVPTPPSVPNTPASTPRSVVRQVTPLVRNVVSALPVKTPAPSPKQDDHSSSIAWLFILVVAGVIFLVVVAIKATGNPSVVALSRIISMPLNVAFSSETKDEWIPKASPRTLKDLTWDAFELLIGEIYRRKGFHAELSAGTGADGGVDLVLRRDQECVLVQCKSWNVYKVNVSEIREFYGVLVSEQAHRGIFVTTGRYTRDALEFAEGKPIEMIDGQQLESLMKSAAKGPDDDLLNVGLWAPVFLKASRVTTPRCPYCKRTMVRRTGPKSVFWGCSTYPRCRGKREMRRHMEDFPLAS